MRGLSKVSIGIKTFLRDDKLFNTIQAIRDTMPEVTMIIADCGEHNDEKDGIYADLVREGHDVIWLNFDAGFSAMSNQIVDYLATDFLLIGSDDFSFRPPYVRQGIEEMQFVLDNTDIDIASGRVRGPYEFWLDEQDGIVKERKIDIPLNMPNVWYQECDLTVNYSLIKKKVFDKVCWDEPGPPIGGGEHAGFFLDAKHAGFKTAYVCGAKIEEQDGEDSEQYKQYRRRASSPERPCFKKRGIKKYVLGNGKVDYEEKEVQDYPEPITR